MFFRVLRVLGAGPVLMVVALVATSCAPKLTKLPSGPGFLAPDIARVLLESLSTCQRVQSLTAEIGVSGSVGGQRLRTRLIGGFTTSATRLEAAAPFGAPLFIFVATGRDGTLLLPRDRRVVEHGDSTELLAAIAGIKLTPSEMVRTLNGCYIPDRLESPMAIGDNWRTSASAGGAKIYMHRDGPAAPWRLVTVFHPGEGLRWSWRADYDDFHDGLPRVIRLVSADPRRFNLQLTLSQLETNVQLKPDVFRVEVPSDADRISLEELKRLGPFSASKGRER